MASNRSSARRGNGSKERASSGGERMFATRNDLPLDIRAQMIGVLNLALATLSDLKSHAKQAHWNVKGIDFFQLHELFDDLAAELEGHIDTVAERATALGGTAMGTARMAATHSILPELDIELTGGVEFVTALAERYGLAGKQVRDYLNAADEAGDLDTADVFTEVSRDLDKRLWFLEAHITE